MTDAKIEAMLSYYRGLHNVTGDRAAGDIRALALEIDAQRQTANQLADQSQWLRAESEGRRQVLERIQGYAKKNAPMMKTMEAAMALGTVLNMVQQLWDSEKQK